MTHTVLKLGVLLLALALGASYAVLHRLRTGPELAADSLDVDGLQAPVEILYDSMGVPHIFAGSVEDLFLAQGHVHATHRLWQMEIFRRVLQGRLSEIFGSRTVETDRFLRTIGLEAAAVRGLPGSDTPMRSYMERYAQGVNAALAQWSGPLPPEFLLLRFRPEPWTPTLTQGIEKIMAWDLADYQTGLNLAAARDVLGDSALAPLMPAYPEWGVTIVDGWPDTPPTPLSAPTTLPPPIPGSLLNQASVPSLASQLLEMGSIARASNSWVVGGSRSRSGKPLLANDMHLALEAPNIWFLVGLHAPGYEVVGMSLPGAPGVVAGHSRAVAWGFTNAMVDDSDFFMERVNPDNPDLYLTPEGWAPFEEREEMIQVRGGDPLPLRVRTTRHGPVVTPVESRAGDRILAFQWVARYPSNTFRALLDMGAARNAKEFIEALRSFNNPHQNVVFADTAGDWGYWMGGRVPVRASGAPPQLPVSGWTGEHDWIGWVPFEEKPHVLAPERGYIATANNAQSRDEQAQMVTDGGWFGPYRAQRISQLLEATDLHDPRSFLAIQMDPGSAFVDRYAVHAQDAFQRAGMDDLAHRLEAWDHRADLESTEATLFHTWWSVLRFRLMEAYYSGDRGYFPATMVEKALQGEADLRSGLMEEAARTAAQFADLPWGEAHTLTLDHPLGAIPVLGSLFQFGRSGIPRVGGPYSVNVAGFGGTRPPFQTRYGPSQRHVVDMADPNGSGGFILPGGQSGYPANDHSFDQLTLWREGRLWLLPLDRRGAPGRPGVEERTVVRVLLEPREGR